jgi:ABC-type taurine transport system substrate-binding protein
MELYHLGEDPSEMVNLAEKHPEKVAEFTKAMIEARDEPEIERFRYWKYESE